ncbi:MAG: spherulation-specific family 4 protein [Bacteroidota bacterium]
MNSVEQIDSMGVDTLNLKVLVPAYFDPSTSNYWERLEKQAAKMPGRLYAIANLDNGPGSKFESSYASTITAMNDSGGKVIGYVWTNYGAVPLSTVEADIDRWYSFYPNMNGIFLDGGASVSGEENYYTELYSYIKQKDSSSLVVTNPGTNTLESYLINNGNRVSDVLCIFENSTGFDTWTPSSWCAKYSRDDFCVLPYSTASTDYINKVNRAASLGIGWIYCTNDILPNPWDTLPPYFEEFCDYVFSGDTATQSTTTGSSIDIDGHFNDWQGIVPQAPGPSYACPDLDADLINVWATNDTSNLYLSYQVAGTLDASTHFYHIFIDVNYNALGGKTGYVYNDSASIGAGYMVENSSFWKYNGSGGSDWSWVAASGMNTADSGGRTELSIPLNVLFQSDSNKTVAFLLDVNQASSPYSVLDIAPYNYQTQCYVYRVNSLTAVDEQRLSFPSSYSLSQNYPNPFNPTTEIQYRLPKASLVKIQVYNVVGQEVATLVNESESAGSRIVRFDGENLSSGVYFYSIHADNFSSVKKMLLLK